MASNHSPVLKLQYNIDQHWPDPEYRIEIFPNKDICLKTSKKTGDVSVVLGLMKVGRNGQQKRETIPGRWSGECVCGQLLIERFQRPSSVYQI